VIADKAILENEISFCHTRHLPVSKGLKRAGCPRNNHLERRRIVMTHQPHFGTVEIDGLKIAYREAGDPKNPKVVLLHGFPASSHQYRNLLVALADRFHVIAPDYQGFGNSDAPDPATYAYTFDGISLTIEKFLAAKGFAHYGLFVQDYGGPVGFRIIGRHPEAMDWLIIQNTNAYTEGFTAAWDAFATRFGRIARPKRKTR
jgi:pimeloyl-ACP methyl ester carboxylesterase